MPDRVSDPRQMIRRGFRQVLTRWATPGAGRVVVVSPLVGVIAGLGAVAFSLALEWTTRHVLGDLMGLVPPPTGEGVRHVIELPSRWWLVLLIPTVGGLLAGALVFQFAPEAEGHGTDALIRAFHRGNGIIRGRVPGIKAVASIITIGSGGSAGQEGPIAQIGAGFGSVLARWLRLTPGERRLVMLSGAAGGIGAIFRAPLGGALFAGEVLYSSTATEAAALLPCLASSIVAYSTFSLFVTPRPIFNVPGLVFHGLRELPVFTVLALVCAVVGWLYVRVFYGMRDRLFHRLPIPRSLKPALGGFLLGLMALVFPELMTGGYGWVQWGAIGLPGDLALPSDPIFSPRMGAGLLIGLALLKIVATGLTISSGGSGGVFGPSIFIGGMLGGGVGQLLRNTLPAGELLDPAAFALVGMGGFFAGVSKTPLASIVMVCEMTGHYRLLVPLMLVCGIHVILSQRWTLYEEQVSSPVDSPAHRGDFVIDVLERLKVRDVRVRKTGFVPVRASTPFDQILRIVANSTETLFPVVNSRGELTGVFSLADVRPALGGSRLGSIVVAADLACWPVPAVTPGDDLHTALRRLTEHNLDEIPVVDAENPRQLVGLLARRELVSAYSSEIDSLRSKEDEVVVVATSDIAG